jgi:hypothetical protein
LGNSGLRVSEAALGTMPEQQRADHVVAAVKTVSDEIGRSMAQVALAWLRYRPVPVIPIIGARKLSQFKDNLASFDLTLSANHLKTLEEASRIEFGFRTIFMPRRWSAPSSTVACETRFWLSSGGSRAEKGWTAKLRNRAGNSQTSFLSNFAATVAEQRRRRKRGALCRAQVEDHLNRLTAILLSRR